MLENAVGDRICGGDGKSFDFRMLAGCEGETPSRQPAGTPALLSLYANLFYSCDCDLNHIFPCIAFKMGVKCGLDGAASPATWRAAVTHKVLAPRFSVGGYAWKIGPLSSLLPSSHPPQPARSSMKAAEHGCSPRTGSRGWRCLEFSPTSSRTSSLTSPRMRG